jgi:hypothetical protein
LTKKLLCDKIFNEIGRFVSSLLYNFKPLSYSTSFYHISNLPAEKMTLF